MTNKFLDALCAAGGTYKVRWSTKRNPGDRYDNVYCVNLYGREGDHGHPLKGYCIINDFGDDGFEVFFPSKHTTIAGDIRQAMQGL